MMNSSLLVYYPLYTTLFVAILYPQSVCVVCSTHILCLSCVGSVCTLYTLILCYLQTLIPKTMTHTHTHTDARTSKRSGSE